MTVGHLQSVLDAISDSDNEIGGVHQTRTIEATTTTTKLGPPFTWNGTATVLSPDTSDVTVGDYIQLDEDGTPFLITTITPNVSVAVDTAVNTPPTGPTAVPLAAVLTWDGSTTVLTPNTAEVGAGVWVRLNADGQWFRVRSLVTNTSLLLDNSFGLTIPTGATASAKNVNPSTSVVQDTLVVETTLNWPDSGKIAVDGVVYNYASKSLSPASFDGLTHIAGGSRRVGLKKSHRKQTTVTDISRDVSALDLVRRAMLVGHAEGTDLNVIGRNLGVLRPPFLADDDIFREVVKALAYNPKATMYGLELALTSLVGADNFVIFEDLINFPNTVFITLTGGPFTSDGKDGKAFLSGGEFQPATSDTTVDLNNGVVASGVVASVTLRDEDRVSDFRSQKPSADNNPEYVGDPGTVWTYSGPAEATDVIQIAGEGVKMLHTAAAVSLYIRQARVIPESYVSMTMVMMIPAAGTLSLTALGQWVLLVRDNAVRVGIGTKGIDATTYSLELISGGAVTGSTAVVLTKGVYYAIELRKYGTDRVELWIAGERKDRLAYSVFTAAAVNEHLLEFGILDSAAPAVEARARQVGFYVHTTRDFWASQGSAGITAAAAPTQFDFNELILQNPADVGKRVRVEGATAKNATGGNSNGVYVVGTYVDAQRALVVGETHNEGTVQSSNPLRFIADVLERPFVFPDDLGKKLVISGSALGNNGTYTIAKLLDDASLTDLASYATELRQETRTCEVAVATFVSEGGVTWRLDPAFVNDSGLSWDLADTGSEAAGTVTLRQSLPIDDVGGSYTRVLRIVFSEVLSAQVLLDATIENLRTQTLPTVLFTYYPFYLADPLGYVRLFVDDVTAAGVIPEYLEA